MIELLSIGDKVAEGRYHLHSRFARAVNFTDGKRMAFLVSEEVGAGPLNIVVRGLCQEPLEPMIVSARSVRLAELRLPYQESMLYCSRLDIPRFDPAVFERGLQALERRLVETAPVESLAFLLDEARLTALRPGFETAFAQKVRRAAEQVFHGELRSGVHSLRGCGFGLTPSGDDFLAGLMFACHLSTKLKGLDMCSILEVVYGELRSADSFSGVFLRLAHEGLFFEKLKELSLALVDGPEDRVVRAADRLFSLGASSGADLATGLAMTLRQLGSFEQYAK